MCKKNYSAALLAVLLLFVVSFSVAQELNGQILTQKQAVQEALQRNPDILASLNQLSEARTAVLQAREFANTSIDFDFDQQKNLFSPDEIYFGISQEIEFPTRNSIRVRLAQAGVSTAILEHELVKWQSIIMIKNLYQQFSFSQSMLNLGKENLEMAISLEDISREKFKAGSVGKLDLLRASVERANAEDELQSLTREYKVIQIKLNYLLGRSLESDLRVTEFRVVVPDGMEEKKLIETALANRIEIKVLQAKKAGKTMESDLVRSLYYPDFTIGVNRHSVYQEADSWDTTLNVSIPVFGRSNIEGQLAKVAAEEKTLETLITLASRQISADVITAMEEMAQIKARLNRFEKVIIQTSEEAMEIAKASYEEGEIGNMELIEVKRTYQEARSKLLQTILIYNETLIKLESSIGRDLSL